MFRMIRTAVSLAALGVASVATMAQTTAPVEPVAPTEPAASVPLTTDQRQDKQHDRLDQGVSSGELTRGETKRLRTEQRGVSALQARANRDGVVTPREQRRINRAQNATSHDIYRQKHDPADRNGAGNGGNASGSNLSADQRQDNQHDRIVQGKESGELTAREAHRLNYEQRGVEKLDNRANRDGTVTDKEAKRVDRVQDAASKDIRRQKHDKRDRGG